MSIEITDVVSESGGIFPTLMDKVGCLVEEQYTKQRINKHDYSTVYLGALNNAMNQSFAFSLQKDIATATAIKIDTDTLAVAADVALKEAQKNLILKDILKRDTEILILEKDLVLKDQQILLSAAEITKITKQNVLLDDEHALHASKLQAAIKQNELLDSKILQASTENLLTVANKDLVLEKIITEHQHGLLLIKQEDELDRKIILLDDEHTVMGLNIITATKNNLLIDQKILSESKRVLLIASQAISEDAKTTTPLGGSIKAQIDLINQQKIGLEKAVHAEKAKIMSNMFNTSMTQGISGIGSVTAPDVVDDYLNY